MSAAETAAPVSVAEAGRLFFDLSKAPALLLAVSGGPDSTALLVLAARWRKMRKEGPKLHAVTIDHGLRPESAGEARAVAKLAKSLGVSHRTLRWTGRKPATGLQEAARAMRYRLLAETTSKIGTRHILTAHTLDDQAETIVIRMARGSGLTGLAAMTRVSALPAHMHAPSPLAGEGRGGGSALDRVDKRLPPSRRAARVDPPHKGGGEEQKPAREGSRQLFLVRPFLDIPKARLIATLESARIPFADDPSNRDPRFTRARLRELMPALAREGLTAERLAVLTRRLRRADAAIEIAVAEATNNVVLSHWSDPGPIVFDARRFADLPAEVALRLLGRAIARLGDEGPVELAKLEALHAELAASIADSMRFRRTLAGASVASDGSRIVVETAPPRRGGRGKRT